MNTKRRVYILFLIAIVMVGICGCKINLTPNYEPPTEKEVILNEKQKKILSQQGLPTEYDKLGEYQQDTIAAIGELLKYLEDKYGVEFEYLTYVPGGILEREQLLAYPLGGDKTFDIVTAERYGGEITDDYVAVIMRYVLDKEIKDFVGKSFVMKDFKVFTETPHSDLDSLPVEISDLSGNFYGVCDIFIDSGNVKEAKFDKFVNKYIRWIKKNRYHGMYNLVFLKEGKIETITKKNYGNYYARKKCLRDVACLLDNNGEMETWED